jgi:hypothetical protein
MSDTVTVRELDTADVTALYCHYDLQTDPDNSAEVRAAVGLIVDPLQRQIDDLRARLATGAIAEAAGAALAPVVAEIGNDVKSIHRRLSSLESYANGMGD